MVDGMMEEELQEMFKRLIQDKGFEVVKEFKNTSPDMIARKDGRLIGIEFKVASGTSFFSQAFGQLMFGKFKHNVSDLWLVVDKRPTTLSKDWIELFWKNNIKLFFLDNENKFCKLENSDLINCNRRDGIVMHDEILKILKSNPNGVSIKEIAKMLCTKTDRIRFRVNGIIINGKLVGGTLKNKVIIENKGRDRILRLSESLKEDKNEDIFYLNRLTQPTSLVFPVNANP